MGKFYKCLFNNNDKNPIATQEKAQIAIKLNESQAAQLNKETCSKEQDIVLKKLKKGSWP